MAGSALAKVCMYQRYVVHYIGLVHGFIDRSGSASRLIIFDTFEDLHSFAPLQSCTAQNSEMFFF